MSWSFRPAARENVSLLIALAGASGSGKTFSALRLAKGLAPNGRIFFIDTEARRGLHYADQFAFQHADMRPPFRPNNFLEGIRAADSGGAEVVILDSFSHEYDGEGGIMDWAAELESGGTKSPGNWKEPKLGHKRLMNALLQVRCHLIFCLRADEKIAIERKEVEGNNGRTFMKTVVTPLGWMPICEKRFMFEMTASFTLAPDSPGLPRYDLPHKVQDQHRRFFPEGQQIGEAAGAALREWAAGGVEAEAPKPAPGLPIINPSGALVEAKHEAQWVQWSEAFIAKLEDAPALGGWLRTMEPHFLSLEKAGRERAVQHIRDTASARLDVLAEQGADA